LLRLCPKKKEQGVNGEQNSRRWYSASNEADIMGCVSGIASRELDGALKDDSILLAVKEKTPTKSLNQMCRVKPNKTPVLEYQTKSSRCVETNAVAM